MPLYETVILVNARASLPAVAQVMKQKAQCVFEHGGVLRRLDNLGIMPLAYPMYRNRKKHYKGRWLLMLSDSSPKAQERLVELIRKDTEVIRWSVQREKNVFREKYDELRIHGGGYERERSSVALDDEKLVDLSEAIDLQRLQHTDRIDWRTEVADETESPLEKLIKENAALNAMTSSSAQQQSQQQEQEHASTTQQRSKSNNAKVALSHLESLFNDFKK